MRVDCTSRRIASGSAGTGAPAFVRAGLEQGGKAFARQHGLVEFAVRLPDARCGARAERAGPTTVTASAKRPGNAKRRPPGPWREGTSVIAVDHTRSSVLAAAPAPVRTVEARRRRRRRRHNRTNGGGRRFSPWRTGGDAAGAHRIIGFDRRSAWAGQTRRRSGPRRDSPHRRAGGSSNDSSTDRSPGKDPQHSREEDDRGAARLGRSCPRRSGRSVTTGSPSCWAAAGATACRCTGACACELSRSATWLRLSVGYSRCRALRRKVQVVRRTAESWGEETRRRVPCSGSV